VTGPLPTFATPLQPSPRPPHQKTPPPPKSSTNYSPDSQPPKLTELAQRPIGDVSREMGWTAVGGRLCLFRAHQAKRATRTVMAQYRSILSLTEEQMQQLKPLFRQTGLEMGQLPKGSTLRLNAVSAFHQKIAPFLTPEPQQLCDGILARVRSRTTDEMPTAPVPSPDP